ncbi:MAG: hypothetical protein WA982_11400 [Rubrobacteraceae bacterium]
MTISLPMVTASPPLGLVPLLARVLGHPSPPLEGWAVAALAVPAVLAADAVHKRWRRR